MKIIYLIERIDSAGGIQRSLSIRANALVAQYNHEVLIVCTEKASGKPYYPLHPDIKLIFLSPLNSSPTLVGRIMLRYRQSRELNALKPDLIISVKYTLHNLFFHFFKSRAKYISELRETKARYEMNVRSIKSKFNAAIRKWVFSKQDLLIVLTQADNRQWGLPNMVVVPNPVTIDTLEQSSLSEKQVLAAGRLTAVKGFDKLLEVWQIVASRHPDWRLKICGEGELHNDLVAQAYSLNIAESVEIPNVSVDVVPEFLSSSVFALTSHYESFGNVLVEAKACGVPSVAFDCPEGPREIISDGEDGFLVTPGDIPEFAAKIIKLIEDSEMRRAMGKKAFANAARFAPEAILSRYHQALMSVWEKS